MTNIYICIYKSYIKCVYYKYISNNTNLYL